MTTPKQDFATAIPTKQFFVSMLTRDIDLADAILDLVDNCLDGALRIADGEVDYSQHSVTIELNADHFRIVDDCGGIPREVAVNYAFKMGRDPDDDRDADEETIGMYGVGMKRAIFKMGREAIVRTRHGDDKFEVPISSEWLDQKDWNPLPIHEVGGDDLPTPGTIIHIGELYPGVARHFSNVAFRNELCKAIAEHFTVFLQEGLAITVNGDAIEPVLVEVLVSKEDGGPAPYVFQKEIDGVLVSIAVGLNTGRGLPGDEDDMPEFERDRSAATAGWTVFCNDRAVIVGDKSRLTGWGDNMPLYHYQYSIITGIVEFRSKKAEKLPVTTTKRALDTSSDVWLEALVKMKEAMRVWISYTNKWKNHPRSDQSSYWEESVAQPLEEAVATMSGRAGAQKSDRLEYNPQKLKVIPEPPSKRPSSRRVVFSRPVEEIRTVSKALFDTYDEKPGVVGEQCFSMVFAQIQQDGAGE